MYLNFFNMKKAPFNVTPDPEFLFLSTSHKEALAAVIYGVEQKKGFVALIGEVGLGKTTVIRSYLARVNRERLRLIYMFNANISFVGLLKSVLSELGLDNSTDAPFDMVTRLHKYLISEYTQGRTVVLIIDEAQNMPVETLENLRMLSNLETAKDKLLQIVFSAQPEFEELLARKELRQLKQRIAVKATIQPLSRDESLRYIRHRLAKAVAGKDNIFTEGAMRLIVRHAMGIPRMINMICDNSLITSYGQNRKSVTARIVRDIVGDIGAKQMRVFRWGYVVAASLLGVITIAGSYFAMESVPPRPPLARSPLPAAAVKEVVPAPPTNPGVAQASETMPAPDPAEKPATVSRLVKKGDTMAGLLVNTYGYANKSIFDLVKKNNPGIKDPDRIVVGETIIFPVANR